MTPPAPAWTALASELYPFVRSRVASDADADDVMQEILLRMHRGLGALRDDDRLTSWAYRIARRALVDNARRGGRAPSPGLEVAEVPGQEPEPPDATEDLSLVIAAFVAALPSPYREAIVLTELEGMSQREAAEMLGVSLTAMKSRVQRGRAKLRTMLDRCCSIELDARNRVVDVVPRPDGRMPDGCCEEPC